MPTHGNLIASSNLTEHGQLNFTSSDTKKLYEENLTRLSKKWIWRDVPLSYNFNSHGFRMNKEIDEVDYDNYIAFFGCSYTVGTGLPLKNTFPYIVSQNLKIDYINTAVSGYSPLYVLNQVIRLLNFDKPPKAIIINWPPINRTYYYLNPSTIHNFHPRIIDKKSQFSDLYTEWLLNKENIKLQFNDMRKVVKLLKKLTDLKIIELGTDGFGGIGYEARDGKWKLINDGCAVDTEDMHIIPFNWKNFSYSADSDYADRARDIVLDDNDLIISHPGIAWNNTVSDIILNYIKNG